MLAWLKRQAGRLPYPLFLRLYLLKERLVERRRARHARRRLRVPSLAELDFSAVKRGDTLFVLGSGPSINAIAPARWQAIARHDSVGMNFWPWHDFVPTFYTCERIDAARNPGAHHAFVAMVQRRAEAYRSVPKILTELTPHSTAHEEFIPPWRERLYAAEPLALSARTEEEFAVALALLRRKGWFEPAARIGTLFKYASSVSAVVSLAVRLQYRSIVLCGLDLARQDYFFQDAARYPEAAALMPAGPSEPHYNVRDFPWFVRLEAVLRQMRRQLLEPEGIALFVESSTSRLWPEVPEAPDEVFSPPGGQSVTANSPERVLRFRPPSSVS